VFDASSFDVAFAFSSFRRDERNDPELHRQFGVGGGSRLQIIQNRNLRVLRLCPHAHGSADVTGQTKTMQR
jgi:hypothetical protein